MRFRRTTYKTPDFVLVADALLTVVEAEAIGAEWKRWVEAGNTPVEGERIWVTVDGREVGVWVRTP